MMGGQDEHWVFAYGSLMWRPGFVHEERRAALVCGRHRAFCIYSVHHRGAAARRGLVLGLAAGGAVRGTAYRVSPRLWSGVRAYLLEREHPAETYVEGWVCARLQDGRKVDALTFLSDRRHPQWAGKLSLEAQAEFIAGARGVSGRNVDYLRDLILHLGEEGIVDAALDRLLDMVHARERSL